MSGEKKVTVDGRLWFQEAGEKVFHIGFTNSFLNTVKECWQVLPANRIRVVEKSPLFSVETNDALFSISSPVSGAVHTFNNVAMDYPDNLTEDDVIVIIGPEKVAAKAKTANYLNGWAEEAAGTAGTLAGELTHQQRVNEILADIRAREEEARAQVRANAETRPTAPRAAAPTMPRVNADAIRQFEATLGGRIDLPMPAPQPRTNAAGRTATGRTAPRVQNVGPGLDWDIR